MSGLALSHSASALLRAAIAAPRRPRIPGDWRRVSGYAGLAADVARVRHSSLRSRDKSTTQERPAERWALEDPACGGTTRCFYLARPDDCLRIAMTAWEVSGVAAEYEPSIALPKTWATCSAIGPSDLAQRGMVSVRSCA